MEKSGKIILVLLLIVIILYILWRKKLLDSILRTISTTTPTTSTNANTNTSTILPINGTPCTIQIPSGIVFGSIVNGKCYAHSGSPCKTNNGNIGAIKNGACIANVNTSTNISTSTSTDTFANTQPSSLLGRNIQIMKQYISFFYIGSDGCLEKKGGDFFQQGTITEILEVRDNYICPLNPNTPLVLFRVKEGWIYYVKGQPYPTSSIQILQ